MKRTNFSPNWLIFSTVALVLSSCHSAFFKPGRTEPARLGERSEVAHELDSLPEPKDPVLVAVYQFKDQTGQYKPVEGGSSFSTAVTQGGTNILLKVLQDSRWFVPIERENIGNLLNERKIIRSTRTQYGQTEDLPALLFAGVILEGGIVSYDANVLTGGSGARYFGAGASSQYRQDRVTVYLRAISVSNGKILKTVYASKQILSQSLEGGLFRYVRFRRLLEAETGVTYNEPSEMAVTEAIEKAVQVLILEGLKDGLWDAKQPGKRQEILKAWDTEKAEMASTDIFGQKLEVRRRRVAFTVGQSTLLYQGDYASPKPGFGGEIGLLFSRKPAWSWGLAAGLSRLDTRVGFSATTGWLDAAVHFRHLPFYRFTPYYYGGAGLIFSEKAAAFALPKMHGGLGFEYFASKKWSVFAQADFNWLASDGLDGVEQGRFNDFFWRGGAGLRFYFGKKTDGSKSLAAPAEKPKPKAPLSDF